MEPLGLWLVAVGLADLVSGVSGRVENFARGLAGWIIGSAATTSMAVCMGFGFRPTLALLAIVLPTTALWLWARPSTEWSVKHSAGLLLSFLTVVLLVSASADRWPQSSGGLIRELIESSPFLEFETTQAQLVLLAGVLLALQATGNALVRALLRMAGNPPSSENELRGGRIIGPLERSLIFSLALAGEPTAAALVISAKGLLRFPELSHEERSKIHDITEYFLIGSLGSWIVALAPVTLLRSL